MLVQVGRSRFSAITLVQAVWHDKQNSAGRTAAHPCKERKDGAPSVEMALADVI